MFAILHTIGTLQREGNGQLTLSGHEHLLEHSQPVTRPYRHNIVENDVLKRLGVESGDLIYLQAEVKTSSRPGQLRILPTQATVIGSTCCDAPGSVQSSTLNAGLNQMLVNGTVHRTPRIASPQDSQPILTFQLQISDRPGSGSLDVVCYGLTATHLQHLSSGTSLTLPGRLFHEKRPALSGGNQLYSRMEVASISQLAASERRNTLALT